MVELAYHQLSVLLLHPITNCDTKGIYREKNQDTMLAPKKTCKILQRRDMETQKGHGDTKPKIEMTSCQSLGLCENEGNEGIRYKSTFHSKCCRQCAIVQICRSHTLFLVLVLQQIMILGVNCMDLRWM